MGWRMIARHGVRRTVLGAAAVIGGLATAPGAAAAPAVPSSAGMLPPAEAPAEGDGDDSTSALTAIGVAFVLGGGLIAARSWVSTREPV